jgi:hypothetical protein
MRWAVGEETMTRIRRTLPVGSRVDAQGYPVGPSEDFLDFPATRDTVPNDVLALLPEGERLSGVRIVITETELRAGSELTGTLPDRVIMEGEVWEVRESQWFPRVIPHYEARVQRLTIDGLTVSSLDFTLDQEVAG